MQKRISSSVYFTFYILQVDIMPLIHFLDFLFLILLLYRAEISLHVFTPKWIGLVSSVPVFCFSSCKLQS